jgi:hypothetical protein
VSGPTSECDFRLKRPLHHRDFLHSHSSDLVFQNRSGNKAERSQNELAKYKEMARAQVRQIAQLTQLKQVLSDEKRALQAELEKRSNAAR